MKQALLLTAALLGFGLTAGAYAQTTPAKPILSASTEAILPSGFTQSQLQAVLPLTTDLRTLQFSSIDLTQGRVVVVGLSAVDRLVLLTRLRTAKLSPNMVSYMAEQPTTSDKLAPTLLVSTPPVSTLPVSTLPVSTLPVSTLPNTQPANSTLPSGGTPFSIPHAVTWGGPDYFKAGEPNRLGL